MGQILYKNPNPIRMKKSSEVTREELTFLQYIKENISFNQDEMMGIVNFSRLYINPHTPNCLNCQGTFMDTLGWVRSFYLQYKDEIDARLTLAEKPIETKTDGTGRGIKATKK